jgi:hypothetical protein
MTAPLDASPELVAEAYKRTAMTAAAIAGTLLVYVVVVEMMTRATPAPEPPALFSSLRIAIFVMAGVIIFSTTIDAAGRLARLKTASILSMGLAEVPAIAGLVLVMMGRTRSDFYMLLAISAYMMVRHFPRRGAWEEYVRRGSTTVVR